MEVFVMRLSDVDEHGKRTAAQQQESRDSAFRYGLALGAAVGLSGGMFVTVVALLVVA
ncbi:MULTISPECIES: hypothetical protein [Halogeometricum]|uniref:hypothetical protein n=1 Tax=Halogeometricum TaxID=60846 RepID=UPI001429F483|nr:MULTISPECIES: hypothetical protein [Halogeometricum]MUV57235.1 hypothetical protein [Halogeometricum sp. CBA1124]